jgi:hypothetical protein
MQPLSHGACSPPTTFECAKKNNVKVQYFYVLLLSESHASLNFQV